MSLTIDEKKDDYVKVTWPVKLCEFLARCYHSDQFRIDNVNNVIFSMKLELAHKVILAAHSEVFAKMLQSEMKEAKNNEINIEDLDPEIILEMLHYCYKGTLKTTNNVQIVLQVLKVADIYQIIKLKDFCEHRLMIEISSDNVLDIIDVADDSNAVDLRQEAIEFIAEHYETVFASDKFKELFFRKQELMFEVVHALSNK
ncbi:speckle-type POZ protein B-like [Cotesia glomerata]|uniref:speckle-type POZ protein B-like n=1 Tax=Cotesia glomerata TaxID=32391 RepID=UPI001D00C8A3|nr:speckle-type POZ protein B-like [Cotesia glomerata]